MNKEDKFIKKLEQRYPQLQKPYFAKYLPVEGEIKERDYFCNPATKEILFASKKMLSWNSDTTQEHKEWKKVKFFLCSRDIQMHDEFWFDDSIGVEGKVSIVTGLIALRSNPKAFKVIGEISPEIIWVKEGDEFEKDEVMIFITDPDDPEWFADFYCKEDWSEELEMGFTKVCVIKCPTCGHFH